VAHDRSPDLYEDAVRQDMSRAFGVVNDEDEFTVQLSCSWATAKGSVEYQACVSHYLDEILAGANYPAVAPTDDYQTTLAQLACEPLRLEGPAVYNGGYWYWTYYAANGKAIARSSESYNHRSDCYHSITLLQASGNDPVFYTE
jgi:uncharacterized protein YegP (UPF0339 family)